MIGPSGYKESPLSHREVSPNAPSNQASPQNQEVTGLTYTVARKILENQQERTHQIPSFDATRLNQADQELLPNDFLTSMIRAADPKSKQEMLACMTLGQTRSAAQVMKRDEMEELIRGMVGPDQPQEDIEKSLDAIYLHPIHLNPPPIWTKKTSIRPSFLASVFNFFTFGNYISSQRQELKQYILNGDMEKAHHILEKIGSSSITKPPLLSDEEVGQLIRDRKLPSLVFLLTHPQPEQPPFNRRLPWQEKILTKIKDSQDKSLLYATLEAYVKLGSLPRGHYPLSLTPLIEQAALKQDSEFFKFLRSLNISSGQFRDEQGTHLANKDPSISNIRFWMEEVKVPLSSIDLGQPRLLHRAIFGRDVELIKYLVGRDKAIADPEVDEAHLYPLYLSVQRLDKKNEAKDLEIIEILLENGARPFRPLTGELGRITSPYSKALRMNGNEHLLEIFDERLARDTAINNSPELKIALLHTSIRNQFVDEVKVLAKKNKEMLNTLGKEKTTPLYTALTQLEMAKTYKDIDQSMDIIKILLENGANPLIQSYPHDEPVDLIDKILSNENRQVLLETLILYSTNYREILKQIQKKNKEGINETILLNISHQRTYA